MSINSWKLIIKNWINCYVDDTVDVNIDTLASIIKRLREPVLYVSPSTSENNVLQEFISEKCPDITFKSDMENDLYIAASVVLYFVCINDKDMNMKRAMCKMLKLEDQEMITKFNKTLLNLKSPILTYKKVEAAIIEACGQDTATAAEPQVTISETPPALRSLHGDVRKLQAALDAERFDKNFLQDELTRTNSKLQKLSKDKEQYKSEIVSLKAKISSCCGQDAEPCGEDSASHQNMMKIVRQLEETEQNLVDAQTNMDDAIHERNIYKAKVDELKVERDKWKAFSQQEASRAGTLEDQLITERSNNESLKELIAELRQHNQKNGLDGSTLECDDPNASAHSFGGNMSVSSEACSNVIEVQLMEERANIVQLKHQLDVLQDKIKTLEQRSSEDKVSFESELLLKDDYIHVLLQQIKESEKEQNVLKESFNDEISKLNNDMNELEQKMKDKTVASIRMFHEKFNEIKQLQEDKLSLLQNVSDKTAHFENKVKEMNELVCNLQEGLIKEQNSKSRMKEDYERVLMKFKEKVLNRNNELVELQNNLSKNSEMIEELNIELRNQKMLAEDFKTKSEDEIESLKGENESLKITLIAKNDEINTLKDNVATGREAYQVLLNNLEQLYCMKNKLLEEFQLLEISTLDKLNKEKIELENQLEQINCNVMKINDQYTDEVKRREISENDIVNLNTCLLRLEDHIEAQNTEIEELKMSTKSLESSITEKEEKISELEATLSENQAKIFELKKSTNETLCRKNDEIADLRKQISKMSANENRASQIIKVSAKYQAIILKRVAEIKNVGVLKELTNFGNNMLSYDNDIRKSLNAGAITMEELENFLETTDKHLRRCSERQLALQKERDRLTEACKMSDSENINMKKYLTELSVYYGTFGSVKDLYNKKLTNIVYLQRTVRREILNLDGCVQDAAMARLERGYTAVMQDLCECAMNFERWVERCVERTISPKKIMQAFTSESTSMSSGNFQSTSLETQLDEIENSFVKLMEEISRAQLGEGAKEAEAVTVMEVRAEYEDKLNRMKAKMKQLYQEQITIFREKQKEEIASVEKREQEALKKLAESSRAYEEHIKSLTSELWHFGEKYLLKSEEAEWLRKKQTSGSLMSLQHINSSGLVPPREEKPRPSDTYSLRSLPRGNSNRGGRGLHMSDEEGEVFDNRCLKELTSTPRTRAHSPRASNAGQRFSELKWRNSLCPPHLKSSYPAETQFAPTVDEDDIKCLGPQRKEVGITAYKKPGPPTPSKRAGRLSATDSELRESLRSDAEVTMSKKTATPSRIKALFRSSRNDNDAAATPRRRLSIFRSKK